jgi:hypothetical protein
VIWIKLTVRLMDPGDKSCRTILLSTNGFLLLALELKQVSAV